MNQDLVTTIAELMIYIGLIISIPFMYRFGRAFGKYISVKWETRHQIVLIDSNGNEHFFESKDKVDKRKVIELLQGTNDKAN
ncbi:hypothetical protein J8Z24_18355 [Pseudoalteromonas sp. SCSIO 43201]|uniref:hypothetical protein n=1 Tax=Pseudoalteromonas sp. SCSIO 43201 TaxID=2822842 RepID=UPI002075D753|nr:hypothetical protein [Pseudoalteromonas sp. SCSIO 43201]USD30923.1 hypothetical protein J8Z24_18355 [Pseudoalteromonas sp. SCSIO 43201]